VKAVSDKVVRRSLA